MTHASAPTFDFRGGPLGQDIFFPILSTYTYKYKKKQQQFLYSFNCFKFFQVTPPPLHTKNSEST